MPARALETPEIVEGLGPGPTGEWSCIEWFYDQPAQDGTLWIDGIELPIVAVPLDPIIPALPSESPPVVGGRSAVPVVGAIVVAVVPRRCSGCR